MPSLLCAAVTLLTSGCSWVGMQPRPGMDYVIGRTMELGLNKPFLEWNLTIHARGEELGKEPSLAGKALCNGSLVWTVKHAFVGLEPSGVGLGFLPEGMNEHGFTVSALTLRSSRFLPPRKRKKRNLCFPMLVPWLLSSVRTVMEAKALLNTVTVTNTLEWVHEFVDFMMFHWTLSDATGAHWVLEFLDGLPKWYRNEIGVLTNDPPYPWHLDNLNNYVGLSPLLSNPANIEVQTSNGPVPGLKSFGTNLLGLPGDLTPPSRFVRLFYLRQFIQSDPERNPGTLNSTMTTVAALLNTIFIVKGTVAKLTENRNPEMTHWAVLKVPSQNAFYLRTYADLTWKLVNLTTLNTSRFATEQIKTGFSGVVDITSSL